MSSDEEYHYESGSDEEYVYSDDDNGIRIEIDRRRIRKQVLGS